MAYKSVVVDPFFETLIAALRDIEQQNGSFVLAMLTPSFPKNRAWDLQVSAHWLDTLPSTRQARSRLENLLESNINIRTSKDRLGFVRVRNLESLMVQTLVPIFDVEEMGTAYVFSSLEQTMFDLPEVIVLVARPALLVQPAWTLSA